MAKSADYGGFVYLHNDNDIKYLARVLVADALSTAETIKSN